MVNLLSWGGYESIYSYLDADMTVLKRRRGELALVDVEGKVHRKFSRDETILPMTSDKYHFLVVNHLSGEFYFYQKDYKFGKKVALPKSARIHIVDKNVLISYDEATKRLNACFVEDVADGVEWRFVDNVKDEIAEVNIFGHYLRVIFDDMTIFCYNLEDKNNIVKMEDKNELFKLDESKIYEELEIEFDKEFSLYVTRSGAETKCLKKTLDGECVIDGIDKIVRLMHIDKNIYKRGGQYYECVDKQLELIKGSFTDKACFYKTKFYELYYDEPSDSVEIFFVKSDVWIKLSLWGESETNLLYQLPFTEKNVVLLNGTVGYSVYDELGNILLQDVSFPDEAFNYPAFAGSHINKDCVLIRNTEECIVIPMDDVETNFFSELDFSFVSPGWLIAIIAFIIALLWFFNIGAKKK